MGHAAINAERRSRVPRPSPGGVVKLERTIRLSQTVAPFGVGAIYDIRGESLVAVDTTRWGGMGERIVLDRLAKELQVEGFRGAPARWDQFSTSGPRLMYARFPRWL